MVDRGEVLDSETQKEKLEQVANKMFTVFQAREFKDLNKTTEVFLSHVEKYYLSEDYDWSELEEAGEDIWDDLYDERQRSDYKWEYTYTLFLSECTGILTFGKEGVTFKRSNATKVIFKDIEGEDWVAELVAKNLTEVYLGEWIDAYYNGTSICEDIYDITVEIPSSLTFNVTKGEEKFASVTAKFDYSISEDGVEYEEDRFGLSLEVKIDDLVAKIQKMSVNGKTGQFVYKSSLVKDGMFVASAKFSSKMSYDLDVEDGFIVDAEVDNASVAVEYNILGELQVKGKCTDVNEFVKIVDKEYMTQEQSEVAAEKGTALLDLKVYYDGKNTVQAKVELEPVAYTNNQGNVKYYGLEPVLVFEDESRYLFYEYFNADDFSKLIDNFNDFILDYEEMLE